MRCCLIISLCSLLVLTNSCNKQEYSQTMILGHAGAGLDNPASLFPDNSLEAVQFALSHNGCDGVELDLRFSSDGTAWLFHDSELAERTTGEGCIESSSDDYLSSLQYTHMNSTKLIRLSDLPNDLIASKKIHLDIKHTNDCGIEVDSTVMLQELIEFKELNPNSELVLYHHLDSWVDYFLNKAFNVFAYVADVEDGNSAINQHPNMKGLVIDHDDISGAEVENWQNQGLEVAIFGLRSSKSTRKVLSKSPNYFLTDDVKVAIREK